MESTMDMAAIEKEIGEMKKLSRPILIGVSILFLLSSACSALASSPPTPTGTMIPTSQSLVPTPTVSIPSTTTSTPITPVIPITGEDVVQVQCQFCVNGLTHMVFVFPDSAISSIETTSPVNCLTAEIVNGKRVLVCNGTPLTSFNLKICSDSSNCMVFPVVLQPCPLLETTGTPVGTITPLTTVSTTPITTFFQPSRTPRPGATPAPSHVPTQTLAPPPTGTTGPTAYP